MKHEFYFPIFVACILVVLCSAGCATTEDNRPIPGTVESTDTKKNAAQNNTPRTNPTPNPEPASQPPGPN